MHTLTGATGLVGAHLAFQLVEQGLPVRIIHRAQSDLSLIERVFGYYAPERATALFQALEKKEADLLDLTALHQALAGTEHLYHCAAHVSFDPRDKKALLEENPTMTAQVVNSALEHGVKKMVHVSSVAALGRQADQKHINEDSQWTDSAENSAYAKGKYRAELEVWRAGQEGLPMVIVNPSIIIGPGPWQQGSAALFDRIADGFNYYTLGVNAYVDVRDLVEIMISLAQSDIRDERFVVAAEHYTYQEIFQKIAKALSVKGPQTEVKPWLSGLAWRWEWLRSRMTGRRPLVTRATARTAQGSYYYQADKVQEALDFQFRSIEDSIETFAQFYRQDHPQGH